MARYYFHLADRHETIPDEDGLEVSDLAKAHAEALKVIEEFRTENPTMATEWEGWRLDVANGSGAIVFSINLDAPSSLIGKLRAAASHAAVR